MYRGLLVEPGCATELRDAFGARVARGAAARLGLGGEAVGAGKEGQALGAQGLLPVLLQRAVRTLQDAPVRPRVFEARKNRKGSGTHIAPLSSVTSVSQSQKTSCSRLGVASKSSVVICTSMW